MVILTPVISLVTAAVLTAHVQAVQVILGNDESGTSPFNDGFDDFVESLLKQWHVPGIAIAVVHEDQTWAKGYGHASLPDQPVTPYTLFQGASTSKSFTASLAALLVDNNDSFKDISWSTPLHDLVGNDFVMEDAYLTNNINFEDALSHRTGLPRHDAVWINNEIDVAGETHALRYLPTSASFRTKWQYCNMMFTAVSHVIQTVTGQWHGDLLREWLWEPLGMKHSYYSYSDARTCEKSEPECKLAVGYVYDSKADEYHAIDESSYHAANGAGGIISNVLDYSKWIRALMYEEGPVSKAGHGALKTPRSMENADKYPYTGPLWYGMGLEGGVYRGEKVFGHGGAIGGYFSHFGFIPDKKWGFVAFQNAPGQVVDMAGWRLLDEFLGGPSSEHAKMNETYSKMADKAEEVIKALPSRLYPDVPSRPMHPSLPLENYTGIYHHPGYGFVNISSTRPGTAGPVPSPHLLPFPGSTGLSLYSQSRHENTIYTLRHVTGEHWIVEVRSHVHNSDVPDGYLKGRFEVSAGGVVDMVGVVMEESVEGDKGWVWFERV